MNDQIVKMKYDGLRDAVKEKFHGERRDVVIEIINHAEELYEKADDFRAELNETKQELRRIKDEHNIK